MQKKKARTKMAKSSPDTQPPLLPPADAQPAEAKMSMFERVKLKNNLIGRVMRALKDAPDDDMRLQIIQEVASLAILVPKQGV